MNVQPAMPFKYQGMDVEALGHLVSMRVVEMLEPVIRRMIWDAISENINGNESVLDFSTREGQKENHDYIAEVSEFITKHFSHVGDNYGTEASAMWDFFKSWRLEEKKIEFTNSKGMAQRLFGSFCGAMKTLGKTIKKNKDGRMVVVGLLNREFISPTGRILKDKL